MRISIFGLGYVGSVSAACFARKHDVIGVDTNHVKVDLINAGKSPIIEKDLDRLIAEAVASGRLRATTSSEDAVARTDATFVCVGTPSRANGSLDLQYLERVCSEIGKALAARSSFHWIAIRSTVLPGTIANVVIPLLESASGKRAGVGFGVCSNPEFLREGSAVHDFDNPPKTVIGTPDGLENDLAGLYKDLTAPLIVADVPTAEMVKYVDNVWHALKVDFANEIGNLCKELDLDGHRVMEIFCRDVKLNLSPYYLKPGFAFGGSCLPKDVRALNHRAKSLDLELPIIAAILRSNELQIQRAIDMVLAAPGRKVGVLGFSFKAGTDDLRESPIVQLAERLLGKGYDLRLYDRNVSLARLTGANRAYIEEHIPHLARLMVGSIQEIVDHSDTIVIGNADPDFAGVIDLLRRGQVVVDLVKLARAIPEDRDYRGICW